MWKVAGDNLQMAEGDFGITLTATIKRVELSAADSIRITFKDVKNGETILERVLTPSGNKVFLTLTKEESERFQVGSYVYRVDWYQGDTFMCNCVPAGAFKVVDKA